jgi:sulfate adenylyltransferase subunit 2
VDHLSRLENISIHVLREAYHSFKRLCMLWSIGKDSTVLLWLARKAFLGHVPFPLLHVDTGYKIPRMIEYRNRLAREWHLDLRVATNHQALQAGTTFPQGGADRLTCCGLLKTRPLAEALAGRGRQRYDAAADALAPDPDQGPFEGVIVGLRADEEGSRSKERYFSPRDQEGAWDVGAQPPEFWNQYNTDFPPGTHVRVHPLLDWTEVDVWAYIEREKMPVTDLYFDQGQGRRYRSLGCGPCTAPVASTASSPREIVEELTSGGLARVGERAGRAQDAEGGGLEELRRHGYM